MISRRRVITSSVLEMKHWSPAEKTMVVELVNARVASYVPTAEQARREAYGTQLVISRWLCADASRIVTDAVQVMLYELW